MTKSQPLLILDLEFGAQSTRDLKQRRRQQQRQKNNWFYEQLKQLLCTCITLMSIFFEVHCTTTRRRETSECDVL